MSVQPRFGKSSNRCISLTDHSGGHHVVVSIFDERTGCQIDDAAVEARVGPLRLAETSRRLEPMKIASTTTYGNFFPMSGIGPFVVRMTIRRPGHDRAKEVQFNYAHPK